VWITIRAKLCNLFESCSFGCEQLRASLKQLAKRTIAFAIPAATVENTQKLYVNIESPQTNKGMGAVRVCALLAGNYELTTDDVSDR